MSTKFKVLCFALCLTVLTPALADYSDLQASASGVSGPTVTVSVYNPTSNPISARVRVTVRLDDDTLYLLSSATYTVAAGATTSVAMSAPANVAEIEDNSEPF